MDDLSRIDVVTVTNPDLNCSFVDPEYGYSHRDYFEVRFDKNPYRVEPGQTRRFPRFIAEHFAKHLTDHILIVRGDKENRPMLMREEKARADTVASIIIAADEPFASVDAPRAQEDDDDEDTIVIDDTLVKPAPVETQEASTEEVDAPPPPQSKTRAALLHEAKELGIEIKSTDTKEILEAKIKAF